MISKMLGICQALSGCLHVFYDTVYTPSLHPSANKHPSLPGLFPWRFGGEAQETRLVAIKINGILATVTRTFTIKAQLGGPQFQIVLLATNKVDLRSVVSNSTPPCFVNVITN